MCPSSSRKDVTRIGHHHRRRRRPAAVVAVVQRLRRPIDGGRETRDAAIAEIDHLLAALMHGAVAHDEKIAMQELEIVGDDLREMRRALLFLAFVEQLDVDGGFDAGRLQRVEACTGTLESCLCRRPRRARRCVRSGSSGPVAACQSMSLASGSAVRIEGWKGSAIQPFWPTGWPS